MKNLLSIIGQKVSLTLCASLSQWLGEDSNAQAVNRM